MLRAAEDAVSKGDVEKFYNVTFAIIQHVEKFYNQDTDVISAIQYRSDLSVAVDKLSDIIEIKSISDACDKVRYGRIMPDSIAMSADFEILKRLLPRTYKNR